MSKLSKTPLTGLHITNETIYHQAKNTANTVTQSLIRQTENTFRSQMASLMKEFQQGFNYSSSFKH